MGWVISLLIFNPIYKIGLSFIYRWEYLTTWNSNYLLLIEVIMSVRVFSSNITDTSTNNYTYNSSKNCTNKFKVKAF